MKNIVITLLVIVLGGGVVWYQFFTTPEEVSDTPGNENEELVPGDLADEVDRSIPSELLWTWQWVETTYSGIEKVRPENPEMFQITFQEQETFSATTDCNTASGSVAVEGAKISFGAVVVTEKACMGPTQEALFLSALTIMSEHEITGDTLVMRDNAGTVMTFQAVE